MTTNFNGMTREEKDLVLHDLCARLPYGVKFKWCDGLHEDYYTFIGINEQYIIGRSTGGYEVLFIIGEDDVKPYLRPMSSMTEEEKKEYNIFFEEYAPDDRWPHLTKNFVEEELVSELIDWLKAHHFDYRGLIPKDLALSTDEFNPYKD